MLAVVTARLELEGDSSVVATSMTESFVRGLSLYGTVCAPGSTCNKESHRIITCEVVFNQVELHTRRLA